MYLNLKKIKQDIGEFQDIMQTLTTNLISNAWHDFTEINGEKEIEISNMGKQCFDWIL